MKSIRSFVFETNSSSMHTLTVPCQLDNWQLYHDYCIKELSKFKKSDSSYEINFQVSTETMVGEDFTIRRYIPHLSIVDKAYYVIATIWQHFRSYFPNAPYDSFYKKWADKEKDKKKKAEYLAKYEKEHEEYLKAIKEYAKQYKDNNAKYTELFLRELKDLEDSLSWDFSKYLCDRDWNSEEEKFKDYQKIWPKVTVNIFKSIEPETNIPDITTDECFSTGCYGNEEFYHAVCGTSCKAAEWLCNPFAAILAGSDEEPEIDRYLQEEEAGRLLDEAWKSIKDNTWPNLTDPEIKSFVDENCYTWGTSKRAQVELAQEKKTLTDFLEKHRGQSRRNPGKLIYPIGG